ncbi:MarR family winged helix-turn-helix transcriptional regulator [Roseivirga sp.]|uniref:MarR family winged helix-turn-helix transcriptional regulator n=1 Tax=Roseivirga sp. TaxID=1964215 RepID=UPI003B523F89
MDFSKALFHLNNNLGYNLYRAYLLFHRELIRALKAYAVTPEQWQVLIILWNHGSVTPTEISRVTLQDLPSISRMLVRMEKNGWIERVENEDDGRSFHVQLTEKGRKSKNEMIIAFDNHFSGFLNEVPKQFRDGIKNELLQLRSQLGDYTPIK